MSEPGDPPDAAEPLDDDERWLQAREEGSPLPPLSRERVAEYETLTEMVRSRARIAPPPSARDELRAALDRDELAGRRRVARRRWVYAATAVAAAAVVLIVLWRRPGGEEFMVVRIEGAEVRGGSGGSGTAGDHHSASVGDRLVVDARNSDLKELRVYRDDRDLVARCPGDPGCAGGGPHWKLTMRFDVPGSYRAMRIDKVVVPSKAYQDDKVALESAGAVLDDDHVIDVR
jgi:hypothetical protein